MFISIAQAQEAATDMAAGINQQTAELAANAPSAANAFAWNMGLILILVIMFYILLIRPQQKRFKEHREMLGALKKGDKVITAGGLVGKIEKLASDDEVIIDLGNSIKVTAVRSTIQAQAETTAKPAKDTTKSADAKKTTKK